MKKTMIAIILSAMTISTYATESIEINSEVVKKEVTDNRIIKNQTDLFKNEPLTEQSIEFQRAAIVSINKKYFEQNNYPKEEIHNLYVSLISLGLNEAAEYLYLNPNTDIDVNEYNESGFTPLMAAAMAPLKGGNVEAADRLIKLGAEVNKGAKKSEITSISIAANVNNYKVLSLLLVNGALFMKADKLDYRPIDYAIKNNSLESALILKEALSEKIQEVTEKNKKNK